MYPRGVLTTLAALLVVGASITPLAEAQGVKAASVGQQTVPEGAYPWAVALERVEAGESTPTSFCGGALIAPRFVITAAHCAQVEGLNSPAQVRQAHLKARFANLPGRPAVSALSMNVPGSYWVRMWGRRAQSDVAIVELASPAPTAPRQVSEQAPHTGQAAGVLGYGLTPESMGVMSADLMQATFVVADPSRCSGSSQTGINAKVFPKNEICTVSGPAPNDGATCPGDSGSPMTGEDFAAVSAVTSWGRLNACRTEPGLRSSVFARLSPVKDWIRRQTGAELFSEPALTTDRQEPDGARMRVGRLKAGKVMVRLNAQGSRWRSAVFVEFARAGDRLPMTLAVEGKMKAGQRTVIVKAPRGWNRKGLQVMGVAARIWYPATLNGVTLTSGY